MFELRPYQSEALDAIDEAYARSVRQQLLVMATGAGKTVVLASLIQQRSGNALVLAHRDRLIAQAAAKIQEVVPIRDMGIVKAEQNRFQARVVVASVQTLSKTRRLSMMPQFDTVIVDEAHRSAGASYIKILEHVCHKDTLLLGVTATPSRSDGIGLDRVYKEIVYQIGLLDLIRQGYLAPLKGRQVRIDADFSALHTRTNTEGVNDYRQDELAALIKASNWQEKVTEAWTKYAADRRTIAFVPPGRDEKKRPAAMAHQLAEYMRGQGIRAAALDGSTDKGIQRQTLAAFERGDIQVLTNVDLLVEGLDIPPVNCVLFCRPTKSLIVYSQAIGRGTRLFPGKEDCLVLDMVGASNRFDLCTLGSLVGVQQLQDEEDVVEAVDRQKEEEENARAEAEAKQLELQERLEGQLISEEVDLFEPPEQRQQKKPEFNWNIFPEAKRAELFVQGAYIVIGREDDGRYGYGVTSYRPGSPAEDQEFPYVGRFYAETWHQAKEQAERIAWALISWRGRSEPATNKQIDLMDRMRIRYQPGITKFEASQLIDARMQRKGRAA